MFTCCVMADCTSAFCPETVCTLMQLSTHVPLRYSRLAVSPDDNKTLTGGKRTVHGRRDELQQDAFGA